MQLVVPGNTSDFNLASNLGRFHSSCHFINVAMQFIFVAKEWGRDSSRDARGWIEARASVPEATRNRVRYSNIENSMERLAVLPLT